MQVPIKGAAMPSGSSTAFGMRKPPSHTVVLREARACRKRLNALSQLDPQDGKVDVTNFNLLE